MIRPAKEILSSTVQGASSPSDQEASSPSTVPMETAPPFQPVRPAIYLQWPPPSPNTKNGRRKFTPRITDSWKCPNHSCQGWWGETDVQGEYWMLDKEKYIRDTPPGREFLMHECETCTGVCWDGGNSKRFAHTGRFYMINTPWIFRGREATWRHGLQCDYPSSEGPRLSRWSHSFKEFGVEPRDGVGVPMKEDEGMKKVMVVSHRQNYPPASLSDTCTSNSEFTTISYPPQKPKIFFCFTQTSFKSGSNLLPHSISPLHRFNGGGTPGPPLFLTSEGSAGVRSNGGGPLGALPPFFIIEGSAGVH